MSNFLYGFQDPSMGFNSVVTPGVSPLNHHPHNPGVSRSIAVSRDPLAGFAALDASHSLGGVTSHHLHHHPHHHPHLTARPSMTPAPRQRHHHSSSVLSTMSPSRSHHHLLSTTTSAPQLLHSSASLDDVQSLDLMRGYLHTDFGDTVLFKSWILRSTWDTLLTCLAFFLLAILYEGIKCYREHLYKRLSFSVRRQVPMPSSTGINPHHIHHIHTGGGGDGGGSRGMQSSRQMGHGHSSPLDPTTPSSLFGKASNRNSILLRILSVPHAVQSLLHILQAVLSYTLMLSFMTFNLYICLSIIAGTGIGYFMFCWRRITVVHVSDCH